MERISAAIRDSYGDPEHPTYFFRRRAIDDPTYDRIEHELRRQFDAVEDDSDTQADVSVVLVLSAAARRWVASLSLVGPFAAVYRIELDGALTVISEPAPGHPFEQFLFQLLEAHGFTVLSRQILETPIRFRLNYGEPPDARVYQVLFTNAELLPWEPWLSDPD